MQIAAVGAVLIGGRSRRMGSDKAHLDLGGKSMVQRIVAALDEAGLEVITVGGPDRVEGPPNVPDPAGINGPLAGLFAALDYSDGRPVFLTAVDQPLLQPATVRRLLDVAPHDAVVPVADGFPQVACAVYRAPCLPTIRAIAQDDPDASIRDLLREVDVRWVHDSEWRGWGETGISWLSVDTPGDLDAIRRVVESPTTKGDEVR